MQLANRRGAGWWPDLPRAAVRRPEGAGLAEQVVFPSGRAVIAQTLDASALPPDALARGGYRELFKESRQAVHPAVLAWLQENCLVAAVESERAARQRHLEGILDSRLAAGWPGWMVHAVSQGAGPVWAPLLRGRDAVERWQAMRTLDQGRGVASASRLFNWSGNPLHPQYEPCLAVPVHGGVTELGEIIAALE
ncbi:MAG: hypothetical protein LC797_06285 [Chloroflexi bacterium]|nr:hypothetical protein [Chloroflexota bacterium]